MPVLQSCGVDDGQLPTGTGRSQESKAAVDPRVKALSGSYLVTFRSELAGNALHYPNFRSEYKSHFSYIADRYMSDPRIKDIHYLTSLDLSRPWQTEWKAEFSPPKALELAWERQSLKAKIGATARVDFEDDEAAAELIGTWKEQGRIWFAEPNYISQISQDDENLFGELATAYQDLGLWWLDKIKLPQALQLISQRDQSSAGVPSDDDMAEGPIIAVLDSGVDYEHPALAGRIWTNDDINAANCTNDIHGCNTTAQKRGSLGNGQVHPFDTDGPGESCFNKDKNCAHGTHVAGLIVGQHSWNDPQTGRSIAGSCPICRIMIIKVVSKINGESSGILDSSIVAAFKYVSLFRRNGKPAVRLMNASFGKFARSRTVGLLLRVLKDSNGTLLIGAAGNEDSMTREYPAGFSDAIAVSAVNQTNYKEVFSNFGTWVDIAAPGSSLYSTVPGGGIEQRSGTSMAAPLVSGVAGLLLSRFPDMDFSSLRNTLLVTADPDLYRASDHPYYIKVNQDPRKQPLLGRGLLDAHQALLRQPKEGHPLAAESDRVTRNCGTVAATAMAPTVGTVGALTLLLTPVVIAFFYNLQVKRTILRKRRWSLCRLASKKPS